MDAELVLRWLHVIGACVLLGTGAGIAFFMVMAVRTGKPALIAHVAATVVIADALFTATAVVAQPVTGYLLALKIGWPLTQGWVALSLVLYSSPASSGCRWCGSRSACAISRDRQRPKAPPCPRGSTGYTASGSHSASRLSLPCWRSSG